MYSVTAVHAEDRISGLLGYPAPYGAGYLVLWMEEKNVACVIVGPDESLAQLLVVFPDELVGGVIDIGGCNLCLFAISFISFPNNDILCAKINYMSIFCGYQRTG